MKKKVHMQSRKHLLITALVISLVISFAVLGIIQTDAAAFYGTLFGSSADVTQDTNSDLPDGLDAGEVWAGKNVTKHADVLTNGIFEVELSALGRDFQSENGAALQYDVVFVLDASSSMDTGNKLGTMIGAANSAIATLLDDETIDGIYNRVAVVTFNNGAVASDWTDEGDTHVIDSIQTAAATNIQQGLYAAKTLLNSARANATPVIILLSDGAPNRHAAYNFASGTPTWVNGSPFDAYGADNSGAYTILYAKWLKTQVSNLKIYTVGYDIASSARAQAVLNITAPTAGITSQLAAAKTASGYDPGSDYNYADATYTATINNLSAIMPSISSGMSTSGPIASDLVITDNLGAGFDFALTNVTLNGAPIPVTAGVTYTDSATGETVLFDAANYQVIYTIPADALSLWYSKGESDAPNSLKFSVVLNNSANQAAVTYYTNDGCTAEFTPPFDNPFYGYVPQSSQTTEASTDYTNTEASPAHWGEPGKPVVSEPDWACSYTKESGQSPTVSSVTVDDVTYTGGVDGAVITVGPRNGHKFPVTVTQDTEVTESARTHTEISFTYDPADGTHTAYRALSCQYDYDARSGNSDILTIDYVTVNGTTYNLPANFSSTGNNGDYVVTVLDGSTEITCFDLEFDNKDVTDAQFSFNNPAAKSVTTTPWIPAVAAETQFTIADPPPDSADDPVSVTAGGKTYSGNAAPFADLTHWSFTQTETEGKIYTVTLASNILTVASTHTTIVPAHWTSPIVNSDNIATLSLTETGWIILAAPRPSESPSPTYYWPQPSPSLSPSPSPSASPSPSLSPVPSPSPIPSPSGGTGVESAAEKLPQTDGISTSTLLGIFGLALICSGGTIYIIVRKKSRGNNNS